MKNPYLKVGGRLDRFSTLPSEMNFLVRQGFLGVPPLAFLPVIFSALGIEECTFLGCCLAFVDCSLCNFGLGLFLRLAKLLQGCFLFFFFFNQPHGFFGNNISSPPNLFTLLICLLPMSSLASKHKTNRVCPFLDIFSGLLC